jgi:hypothetical protein
VVTKSLKRKVLVAFSVPKEKKEIRSEILAFCTAFLYGEIAKEEIVEKYKDYQLK